MDSGLLARDRDRHLSLDISVVPELDAANNSGREIIPVVSVYARLSPLLEQRARAIREIFNYQLLANKARLLNP